MIHLTETAAGAINSAIAASDAEIRGLRITVESGGCSGMQYQMGLVERAEPDDLAFESLGVQVFIDPSSAPLLSGTTIDFIDGLEGTGFSFDNPQAKSKCGCGNSFCA